MNYNEFLSLDEAEQLNIVIGGHSISTRDENEYIVLLSAVSDFFVEVYFDMDETRVAAIRPIKSFSTLEPYWKLVSINEVKELLEAQDLL